MNLLSRKPREKDTREVVFDARPHSHVEAVDEMLSRFRDPILEPRTESEVMPHAGQYGCSPYLSQRLLTHDTRPESATRANRLDDIATLVRILTYGEVIQMAEELLKCSEGKWKIAVDDLAKVIWDWSVSRRW